MVLATTWHIGCHCTTWEHLLCNEVSYSFIAAVALLVVFSVLAVRAVLRRSPATWQQLRAEKRIKSAPKSQCRVIIAMFVEWWHRYSVSDHQWTPQLATLGPRGERRNGLSAHDLTFSAAVNSAAQAVKKDLEDRGSLPFSQSFSIFFHLFPCFSILSQVMKHSICSLVRMYHRVANCKWRTVLRLLRWTCLL